MSECRSCGAPVLWGVTERGKRIPLDPDPVANGNLVIVVQDGKRLVRSAKGTKASRPKHVSHFATCPNASQHRRRK